MSGTWDVLIGFFCGMVDLKRDVYVIQIAVTWPHMAQLCVDFIHVLVYIAFWKKMYYLLIICIYYLECDQNQKNNCLEKIRV